MDSRELQSERLQLSLQEDQDRMLKTGQTAIIFVLSNDLIRGSFSPDNNYVRKIFTHFEYDSQFFLNISRFVYLWA
jgi:hypothetical protein